MQYKSLSIAAGPKTGRMCYQDKCSIKSKIEFRKAAPVRPGVRLKSSRISIKNCSKNSHSTFYSKSAVFKIAQVTKYLGCFLKQIRCQEFTKIAQSGHTTEATAWPKIELTGLECDECCYRKTYSQRFCFWRQRTEDSFVWQPMENFCYLIAYSSPMHFLNETVNPACM